MNLEIVDLDLFEPLTVEKEGNRGAIDPTTGQIVQAPSSFAEKSAQLIADNENAAMEEALAKNPKRGRPSNK